MYRTASAEGEVVRRRRRSVGGRQATPSVPCRDQPHRPPTPLPPPSIRQQRLPVMLSKLDLTSLMVINHD